MRVSAKAEYACIAMLELAANFAEPGPVRVKSIHDAHGIPLRFLVQILLQLKAAGLVASVRGAAGGYQLARAPSDITLADIIGAIDPEQPARPNAHGTPSAAREAIHSVWREIQAEEQRILEQLTLAELVRRTQETNALTYQI
jgi:Rrf2 family cysteine metabolism transcriptional repressor